MVKIINGALKIMFKYLKWDIIFKNVIPVWYLILTFQVLLSTAFSNLWIASHCFFKEDDSITFSL